MATLVNLASRLRSELGDTGKSFVYTIVADGTTNRFLLPYNPVDGLSMVVHDGATDVSLRVTVEETTGYITFDYTPTAASVVTVAGQYFKYFTNTEVNQFINDAFLQHTTNHTDAYSRHVTMDTLPLLEEYPVVIYAATLALYTLTTDASFDINIFAPDGVTIPRSERFQQLSQMIQTRKDQYRELCSQLGIGLYKIDVFSLRRISKTTNMYVPIYQPMEVDDVSSPIRVNLPHPTYGNIPEPTTAAIYDLTLIQGDSWAGEFDLPFDLTGYTVKSQIRQKHGSPTVLAEFTVAYINRALGKVGLSLTSQMTQSLPTQCVYDIQVTSDSDATWQHTYVEGMVYAQPQVTM